MPWCEVYYSAKGDRVYGLSDVTIIKKDTLKVKFYCSRQTRREMSGILNDLGWSHICHNLSDVRFVEPILDGLKMRDWISRVDRYRRIKKAFDTLTGDDTLIDLVKCGLAGELLCCIDVEGGLPEWRKLLEVGCMGIPDVRRVLIPLYRWCERRDLISSIRVDYSNEFKLADIWDLDKLISDANELGKE